MLAETDYPAHAEVVVPARPRGRARRRCGDRGDCFEEAADAPDLEKVSRASSRVARRVGQPRLASDPQPAIAPHRRRAPGRARDRAPRRELARRSPAAPEIDVVPDAGAMADAASAATAPRRRGRGRAALVTRSRRRTADFDAASDGVAIARERRAARARLRARTCCTRSRPRCTSTSRRAAADVAESCPCSSGCAARAPISRSRGSTSRAPLYRAVTIARADRRARGDHRDTSRGTSGRPQHPRDAATRSSATCEEAEHAFADSLATRVPSRRRSSSRSAGSSCALSAGAARPRGGGAHRDPVPPDLRIAAGRRIPG